MARITLAVAAMSIAAPMLTAIADVAADPLAYRQAELVYQVEQDCGSCHGLTMKGGLGPAILPANLADRSEDSLADIILNGVPGTPMPPWSFEISKDEAVWIARRLKEGL
jgi:cytochrome c55X